MPITREEVLKIAELAKLHFDEESLAAFTAQFQRILDYIEKLSEVDVEGIEAVQHVLLTDDLEEFVRRDDQVGASLSASEALANAPNPGRGHFRVPRVL
jgi:aspartyl-tRNA(Asn)/glutamyl-tRNA(Gln) amidotransferase subunit C